MVSQALLQRRTSACTLESPPICSVFAKALFSSVAHTFMDMKNVADAIAGSTIQERPKREDNAI